jgi:hypothetical protein
MCSIAKAGFWYAIDFDDEEYGGYNLKQFEALVKECSFLRLVERPGLLRSGMPWTLEMGRHLRCAFDGNEVQGYLTTDSQ